MPTNELLAEVDFLRAKLAEKEKRLAEAIEIINDAGLRIPNYHKDWKDKVKAFHSIPTTFDMVLVRREDLEKAVDFMGNTAGTYWIQVCNRLKVALEKPC